MKKNLKHHSDDKSDYESSKKIVILKFYDGRWWNNNIKLLRQLTLKTGKYIYWQVFLGYSSNKKMILSVSFYLFHESAKMSTNVSVSIAD